MSNSPMDGWLFCLVLTCLKHQDIYMYLEKRKIGNLIKMANLSFLAIKWEDYECISG